MFPSLRRVALSAFPGAFAFRVAFGAEGASAALHGPRSKTLSKVSERLYAVLVRLATTVFDAQEAGKRREKPPRNGRHRSDRLQVSPHVCAAPAERAGVPFPSLLLPILLTAICPTSLVLSPLPNMARKSAAAKIASAARSRSRPACLLATVVGPGQSDQVPPPDLQPGQHQRRQAAVDTGSSASEEGSFSAEGLDRKGEASSGDEAET